MKIRCCVCKKILGEKEPLEDKSYTDTYCEYHALEALIKNGLASAEEYKEFGELRQTLEWLQY